MGVEDDESNNDNDSEEETVGKTGDFKIAPLPTDKDKIKQPEAADLDVIPRLTSNILFVGASGSGKSTLLINLIKEKQYWRGWFDKIVLVSPTAKTDDIQKHIQEIKDVDLEVIDDLKEAPKRIRELMDEQRADLESMGAHKATQILLMYDDVIADRDLLKSDEFGSSFIMSRHFNFTTALCAQSFTQVPRKCRLQCQNLFYFRGSNSELELLAEEFSPPGFTKKQARNLISFATDGPYAFFHCNRRVPFEIRYRRNLDEVIVLDSVPDGDSSKDDPERAPKRQRRC